MKKAFHLLNISNNMTVTKNELRRVITTFLLPLTREQFQDVLAQVQCGKGSESPSMEEGMQYITGACNLVWLSPTVPNRVLLVTIQLNSGRFGTIIMCLGHILCVAVL